MERAHSTDLGGLTADPQPRHAGCRVGDGHAELRTIDSTALAEYASELLGLDIQAVILARSRSARSGGLQTWELMTQHGLFWLVEDGGVAELFVVGSSKVGRHPMSASGVMQAMSRYRELHVACGSTQTPVGDG